MRILDLLIENDQDEEQKYIDDYKKLWSKTPYPVTFVTVDAVVVQNNHILIIERKRPPGRGKLALPGGFLDQEETMMTGMLRELHEETMLDVPVDVLKSSIKGQRVFDEPKRSARGRVITQAFLIVLPEGPLPKVLAADDAAKAFWMPLSKLRPEMFFEDHFSIIQTMIG